MAGRTREKVQPTAAQRIVIRAAKEAIDALVKKLVITSGFRTPVVRAQLAVQGDNRFGLAFKDGEPGKHIVAIREVYPKLGELFAHEVWSEAAKTSTAEIVAAAQALNAVLVSFVEAPLPLPVQREGVRPFSAVARSLWVFSREGASSHPLPQPTFEDFDKGRVIESRRGPVQERLEHKNGALCYLRGISAYGKTTTALVVAFAEQRRGFPASYLDFSYDYDYDDASIVSAFETLIARGEKQIVVIDNAHRNPRLIRSLHSRWEAREQGKRPKLLIVGSRISYPPTMQADYVMHWPVESTLDLTLEPSNFGDIAKFYVKRARSWDIDPPELTQINWSRLFANHLHAFTFAVLARANVLGRGENWALSVDHALNWIEENWLRRPGRGESVPIGSGELDNLVTLCAFGEDRFELAVPEIALPHAEQHLRYHRSLGVVRHSESLRLARDTRQIYQLMEHGWGELILQAARIPFEDREAIRAKAIRQSSAFSLAVAHRLRTYGSADLLELIRSLDRGYWLQDVSTGSLGEASGWLALLRGCDTRRANRLAENLKTRMRTDSAPFADLTFGQLTNLADQIVKAQASKPDAEKSAFLLDLALLDPPAGCTLVESAEQGLTANQLVFMSRLPVDSSLRRKLEGAALKAIPLAVDATLGRSLGATTQLLDQLNLNLPAGFERALDELTEPSRAARLSDQVAKARIREFQPANRFYHNRRSVNERVVDLIFRPLAGTDWAERTKPLSRPFEGAPWLIKSLVQIRMEEDAARLAELVARRADVKDLVVTGHSGHKRVEMVAWVCLACSDGVLTRSYLKAMAPLLDTLLRDRRIYRGLIADGLGALAQCEDLNLEEFGLDAAIKVRLGQLPDPEDQSAEEIRALGEYVRQFGSIANGWPAQLFDSEIKAFVGRVGMDRIMANPFLRVPESAEPLDHLPSYQMQYWQGLFAIHLALQLELTAEPAVTRQIYALLQGNREYQADNHPKGLRSAARLTSISEWLARAGGEDG